MGKRKNLIGQTFGLLTVLFLSEKKKGTTYLWACKCGCDNKELVYATTYQLTHSRKISCGCLHNKQIQELGKQKSKHFAGEIIQNYQLLSDSGKRRDGKILWNCKCLLCGRTKEISTEHMRESNSMPLCDCQKSLSKGENLISNILSENNIKFEREYSFDDLRSNGKKMRFDFRLEDGTLIEYDGRQHYLYDENGYGKDLEQIQKRDKIKNEYCLLNNLKLIRIPYTYFPNIELKDLLAETSNFIVKEV